MRQETRIIAVTFEGEAQHYEPGHFTIPSRVANILGLVPGDPVHLVIRDARTNDSLFSSNDPVQMKSGTEIYGLGWQIAPGQLIRVTVSRVEDGTRPV
jgi:hypothetical protein